MTGKPDPKAPVGTQDPQNMGGPAFHPDVEAGDVAKHKNRLQPARRDKGPTQILKEEEVPPL